MGLEPGEEIFETLFKTDHAARHHYGCGLSSAGKVFYFSFGDSSRGCWACGNHALRFRLCA